MKIKKEYDFQKIEYFLQTNFSSPTHWPDWNKVVSKFYETDFFYYTAYENNDLVGICPAHGVKNGLLKNIYSGQFHYIPNGGWIFKEKMSSKLKSLPLKFNETLISSGMPVVDEFNIPPFRKDGANGLTLVVNLEEDLDHIWMKEINAKRRNMIRKASKNGVRFLNAQKDQLTMFYKLYDSANNRYNIESLPLEFFRELFDKSINIKFDVLLAEKDSEILSGVVIAYDKNYAIYWLGFSANNTPNLGQGDLLQWEAIKRMKEYGCKYYDLCYIEKERLPHIYEFKKGFSKNEVKVPAANIKPLPSKILNKLNKAFRCI